MWSIYELNHKGKLMPTPTTNDLEKGFSFINFSSCKAFHVRKVRKSQNETCI